MKLSGGPQQVRPERRFHIDVNGTSLYSLAVSREGQHLLAGLGSSSDNVSLSSVQSGECSSKFKGLESAVYSCAFSSDDCQVASGSQRGVICVHDIERPEVPAMKFQPHANVIHSLAFRSPGAERGTLCTASADGTVKIFDTRARNSGNPSAAESVVEIVDAAASGPVYQAIFRRDFEVITCGDDDCIK